MDKIEVEDVDKIQDDLKLAHSDNLINRIKTECESLEENETKYAHNYEYFYSKESLEAANVSAAAVVTGIKKILDKSYENGYCIVRPPGHHANMDEPLGFCLYNNVAVAAKLAL
jgi:acetoin utilization deacetylase AcuC-like enzyme